MTKLKSEQDIYRENILKLHDLKNETSHLQHSLQRAYVQLKHRFQDWWASETGETFNQPSVTQITNSDLFSIPARTSSNSSIPHNTLPAVSTISDEQFPVLPHFGIDSFPPVYESETMDYLTQFPGLISENYSFGVTGSSKERPEENVTFQAAILPKFNIPDDLPPFPSIPKMDLSRNSSKTKLSGSPVYRPSPTVSRHSFEAMDSSYELSPRNEDDPYISRLQMQNQEEPPVSNNYAMNKNPTCYLNYLSYNVPEKLVSHSNPSSASSKSGKSKKATYYKSDSPKVLRPSTSSSECLYDSTEHYDNLYEILEQNCHYTPVSTSVQPRPQSNHYRSPFENASETGEKQQGCVENTHDPDQFLQSVPLTGDPDVDDEILSFYRTKQNLRLFK